MHYFFKKFLVDFAINMAVQAAVDAMLGRKRSYN